LADPAGVLVIAELSENGLPAGVTSELISLAKVLSSETGQDMSAIVMGDAVTGAAELLGSLGAKKVFVAEDPGLARYQPDAFVAAVVAAAGATNPEIVLLSHTPLGQDLAPRVACALEGGLVSDCTAVEVENGRPVCTRAVYGGNVVAAVVSNRTPLVATVRQHAFDEAVPGDGQSEVVDLSLELPDTSGYSTGEVVLEASEEIALEDANVVVSGGRGMGGQEGFDELVRLARLLGGAVGASRPPVDSGWISTTAQVGITGKIVAPDAYIAVGLSGSSQHLTGMSDSRKIIVINNDPDAYIFKVSDYGVVGDWRKVLPAFTDAVERLMKEGGAA